MSEWTLAPQAENDLLDLYLYGITNFGRADALDYINGLQHCFALLAEHPHMGRPAEMARRGARRFEHGRHVIYYEERGSMILVLAIVHERSLRGIND